MAIIYHYCDASAFISIANHKRLWLTNTRKMNDHAEGFVIERAILQWVTDMQSSEEPQPFPDAAEQKIRDTLAMNRPELYACCFSRERDSTAQWLNYADRGRGFAIGFDETTLYRNRIAPWNHSTVDGAKYVVPIQDADRLSLTPVLYVDDDRVNGLLTDRLLEKVRAFLGGGSADSMVRTTTFFSSIAKDSSFKHENELRLIYQPDVLALANRDPVIIGSLKDLKWRASNYGVTPYFEFPFEAEAIREVWIGPANPEHRDHAARHLLSTMLKLNGLSNVQLVESRSTYR